jgi:hypothetical protein
MYIIHPITNLQRPRSPALKLQPVPSYGNSPDEQQLSEANVAPLSTPSNNHNQRRSTFDPVQQPQSHNRTRRQQSRDEPTALQIEPNLCASAVTRTGAANRVPFLHRTRPRHAQPGEPSLHTRYVLHTEIGWWHLTLVSNGDSGMRSVLDSMALVGVVPTRYE